MTHVRRTETHPLLAERASGVLLHVTSLPGPHGIGDLGPEAHRFVDWLGDAGQRFWQLLPVGPLGGGTSPYSSTSSFAGEELLISLEELAREGWLAEADLHAPAELAHGPVDFEAARAFKKPRLARAYEAFRARGEERREDFAAFCDRAASWLEDYARLADGGPEYHRFCQYVFDRQWRSLREHALARGVRLFGDLPIYVEARSIDVQANPELFRLDREGRPLVVSGVPPDAFSETGQLWGHPHYRWSRHRRTGYAWWIERLTAQLERYDVVRIDHFIAFHRAYEVRAGAETALEGRWRRTPGADVLLALRRRLAGPLPLVAEDLGLVTPEVRALADDFALPGMRVLLFAFDEPASDYLPHRHPERSIAYTGTHDNDTALGWLQDASPGSRERALTYVGGSPETFAWDLVRAAWTSPAAIAIAPMQDLLQLGGEARLNTPGTVHGNWTWRVPAMALSDSLAARLRLLTAVTDRRR